ncbi:unnamed protein product [Amoebophrya sp. A25]|nr:unnamed protein product [Amoebophrya sp. A25]|eukprot:GSA25T00016031001.1
MKKQRTLWGTATFFWVSSTPAAGAAITASLLATRGRRRARGSVSTDPLPTVTCAMPTVFPKNTEVPKDETRPKEDFPIGYELQLRCAPGFVADTAPMMVCHKDGYFETKIDEYGGCVPEPNCPAPRHENHNAVFAGITDPVKGAQYKCAEGYSLDGRDGGAYGAAGNMYFWVSCDTVNELWNDWEGKCQEVQINSATAFKSVFEIIFKVDCKNGVLRPSLYNASSGPDYAEKLCAGVRETAAKARCDTLASGLDGKLRAQWDSREGTAAEFCTSMWSDVIAKGEE